MPLVVNIKTLQDFATYKGGKLLSEEYINSSTKLLWQCSNGHSWLSLWNNVKSHGSWCPKCSNVMKPTLEELRHFATKCGGSLISNKYNNNYSELSWSCNKGHSWRATWNNISKGTWCPICISFKTESQVRQLLEEKLQIPLPKTRVYYSTNKQVYYEFDGFNRENKIAFEYHGIQHYKYPNFWHKSESAYLAAKQRDREKEQYCIDNKIKLFIIPYTAEKELSDFVLSLMN